MAEPIIRTEHLSVVYNKGKQNEVRSLWDANITIYPEEFVIIHGPSGCGKSTLMYSIASLQLPTSGEVFLSGKALSAFSKNDRLQFRRTGMGMIFQAFYLIETLRVIDNVCLPKVFRNESKEERREAASMLLKRFDIGEQSERYPSQLSGGQKQRVAIARALVNNPNIILADEPVGNLDSESARIVLGILRELVERDKKTVILVTHDPAHLAFGDRIIHMKDGRVIKEEVRRKKEGVDVSSQAVLEKETVISPELSVLMRSFRGLPKEYIQSMLSPFKAHQAMFHFMSNLSEEQWIAGERLMRERLDNVIGAETLFETLDKSLSDGGMGLNRTRAKSIAGAFEATIHFTRSLNDDIAEGSVSEKILTYLKQKFTLELDDRLVAVFSDVIERRLAFAIGKAEVLRILDTPEQSGGMGLHYTTAEKIAQEIELIFLLRY